MLFVKLVATQYRLRGGCYSSVHQCNRRLTGWGSAVSVVLARWSVRAYSTGRVWRHANWAWLQTEPEDRFSGRRRSPQQTPALATGGGQAQHHCIKPVPTAKKRVPTSLVGTLKFNRNYLDEDEAEVLELDDDAK